MATRERSERSKIPYVFLWSLLALGLCDEADAASGFSCTEVPGFSQSMEWSFNP